MIIRFRSVAKADLQNMKSYYDEVAPKSTQRVLDEIFETIDTLRLFPYIGRRVEDGSHRRIVTPKYRFVIVYVPASKLIDIVGIFRHENR